MKKRIPGRRRRPQPKYKRHKKKERLMNLDPDEVKKMEKSNMLQKNTGEYVHVNKKDRKKYDVTKKLIEENKARKIKNQENPGKRVLNPNLKTKKKSKKKFDKHEEDDYANQIFKMEKYKFGEVVNAPPKLDFPVLKKKVS